LHWGKDRAGKAHRKRRTSRQKVRNSLQRCTAWGKEPRQLRRRVLFERRHSKLRGYDNDDGVHGNTARLPQCFHRAIRLLMTWLKRRSQRRGDNWHGSTEVLKHFKVERPRMVGRPRPKKAVLMAEANMRKRVWLKSPVRENRTPGSGRGRSGNWPSYRDGVSSRSTQPPRSPPTGGLWGSGNVRVTVPAGPGGGRRPPSCQARRSSSGGTMGSLAHGPGQPGRPTFQGTAPGSAG
jgi:hypothetical protein